MYYVKSRTFEAMLKAIGIDFGLKRTGFSITDDLGIIATPIETIDSRLIEDYIEKLVLKENINCIVIGYPLSMDGSDTDITENVRMFHSFLESKYPDINIVLYDERMTSIIAQKTMVQISSKKQRKDKRHIDKMSATIILQDYLTSINSSK